MDGDEGDHRSPSDDRSPTDDLRAPLHDYRRAVARSEAEVEEATGRPATPRLSRHVIRLDDGHEVTVAVAGHGVPFVVVHGFMAEGFMYAQSLSRLVGLGFKVVAVDTAGHGGTEVLPDSEYDFDAYVELFERALDHLGIRSAVLTGHSMGGRIVAELAAGNPERAIALLLIDPILGRPWDRIVARARVFPPVLAWLGAVILLDTASTFPLLGNRAQAAKLFRLLGPTLLRHVRQPWRLLAPAAAILRSGSSRTLLERIRRFAVPTVVVHGERDYVVPLATGRDAAERSGGDLVVVHRATHSWPLKDPETLPALVQTLFGGRLGRAYEDALGRRGLDDAATVDEVEAAFYDPSARVLDLTPELRFEGIDPDDQERRHQPRYRFSRVDLGGARRDAGAEVA